VNKKMDRNFGGNRSSRPMNRSGPRDGGNRDGGFGMAPPVRVGEEFDARVEAVGEKGDGVVKKNGFVVFVPGVKEGQNVKVRVTRVLRKVGFGEVVGAGSAPAKEEGQAGKPQEEEETYSPENDSDDFGEEGDPVEPEDADSAVVDDEEEDK
jgi:predicted RNA-binding protein with TRAM domain